MDLSEKKLENVSTTKTVSKKSRKADYRRTAAPVRRWRRRPVWLEVRLKVSPISPPKVAQKAVSAFFEKSNVLDIKIMVGSSVKIDWKLWAPQKL